MPDARDTSQANLSATRSLLRRRYLLCSFIREIIDTPLQVRYNARIIANRSYIEKQHCSALHEQRG